MELVFDSHAHYDDEQFDADREEILSSLPSCGVCSVINAASNLESAEKSIVLAEQFAHVFAAVGVHPHDAQGLPGNYLEILRALAAHKKAVAIGEIGLDYHYDYSPRDIQREVFTAQIRLANELELPVIIHDREAHGDMYDILRRERPKSGVIHCFSGSVELARETITLGLHIGLGGAVTFKNAKTPIEVAAYVPLDRLLLETDAPYMAPVPYRGKRCDSTMIPLAAEKIAGVKGISVDAVIRRSRENAENLFIKDWCK